jgi:hypothetical protein
VFQGKPDPEEQVEEIKDALGPPSESLPSDKTLSACPLQIKSKVTGCIHEAINKCDFEQILTQQLNHSPFVKWNGVFEICMHQRVQGNESRAQPKQDVESKVVGVVKLIGVENGSRLCLEGNIVESRQVSGWI